MEKRRKYMYEFDRAKWHRVYKRMSKDDLRDEAYGLRQLLPRPAFWIMWRNNE